MDVLILIAYVSRTLVHKKNKKSLSNLLLHYNLSPGTFRKWAKDFLLMTETDYVPGMNIWEACYKSLDRLTSSDQFRDFYKKHMEGVSKGTWLAPFVKYFFLKNALLEE